MIYLLDLLLGIVLYLLGKFFLGDQLSTELTGAAICIFSAVIIKDFGHDLYRNRSRMILRIKCLWLAARGKDIRFSMSYLYRIKINDKYLLVKNSNYDLYQFVGGKYKRLPETSAALSKFEARDDFKLGTSGLMKDDMVVFVPAKNAIKFLDWFNSGKDREVSHWREFYEELIDGKAQILNRSSFPYVNYRCLKTIRTPLKKAPGWDCYEILQYDVLELIPDIRQEEELIQLINAGDTDYSKWADHDLIQCLGFDTRTNRERYKIGHHTKWALNLKWSSD